MFDPSWNPAEDRCVITRLETFLHCAHVEWCYLLAAILFNILRQAVDRAYRIGQSRDVIVYRMIMAGTVEEKMYEKQVSICGIR
jgi:hypothetical protein